MKRIIGKYNKHEVEITNIVCEKDDRMLVSIQTIDGTKPFCQYYFGAGCGFEDSTIVQLHLIDDIHIEDDPFFGEGEHQPSQKDEEYEIPAWLDEQMMYWDLRHGG